MAKFSYPNIPDILITSSVSQELKLCICIPCYKEPDIKPTIHSLINCNDIDHEVEVIILINESDQDDEKVSSLNQQAYEDCIYLSGLSCKYGIKLSPIYVDNIGAKQAGVGYARRLAMDLAYHRFSDIDKPRGVIVCLDADTIVSNNYLSDIVNFFYQNVKLAACSIAFEHKLEIDDLSIKNAICDYELHLRYFINMQRLIELPFAYQTVGSAMAVTADAYKKQGGMNTRKAGEDFYFLHKFIKADLVGELNTATVFPSARISDRVPFGTGKAVGDITKSDKGYLTYKSDSFFEISKMVKLLPEIFDASKNSELNLSSLSDSLNAYLVQEKFHQKIVEIKGNTVGYDSFRKRFFHWFDAFRLMKCLHYLRDNGYANVSVSQAIEVLFKKLDLSWSNDKYENLRTLRSYDRKDFSAKQP